MTTDAANSGPDHPEPTPEQREVLNNQIEQHPGTIASRTWKGVVLVWTALIQNKHELTALLIFDDERVFADIMRQGREDRELYWTDLYRRLTNYLNMLSTLVDHTRIAVRQYPGTQLEREYGQRVSLMKASPLHLFLRDLRNYVTHVSVPPFSLSISWSKETGERKAVELDSASLLENHKWSSGARDYLESIMSVNLLEAVEEHAQRLHDEIYQWYFNQFTVRHSRDIDAVNELIRQSRTFYGRDWDDIMADMQEDLRRRNIEAEDDGVGGNK